MQFNRGFTLIELIVSLSIVSIIVVMTASAMRLGIKSVEKGEFKIESVERLRASVRVIQSQIESFIPVMFRSDGKRFYYFEADENGFFFPSSVSLWGRERGIVLIRYDIVEEEEGRGLSLTIRERNIIDRENERETVLLRELDDISFSFLTVADVNGEGEWVDTIEEAESLPELIAIKIVDGHFNIEIVMTVRVSKSKQIDESSAQGGLDLFE